jgi:hypothetical protein
MEQGGRGPGTRIAQGGVRQDARATRPGQSVASTMRAAAAFAFGQVRGGSPGAPPVRRLSLVGMDDGPRSACGYRAVIRCGFSRIGYEPHQAALPEGATIMGLATRKISVLAAGTLALVAMARYGLEWMPSPPYSPGMLQCRSVDVNGLPAGCVSIDLSRFGFAALRGM